MSTPPVTIDLCTACGAVLRGGPLMTTWRGEFCSVRCADEFDRTAAVEVEALAPCWYCGHPFGAHREGRCPL